jgi:hypothetical protein
MTCVDCFQGVETLGKLTVRHVGFFQVPIKQAEHTFMHKCPWLVIATTLDAWHTQRLSCDL